MSTFCGKCGKPLESNDKFCPGCGAPIEAPATMQAPHMQPMQQGPMPQGPVQAPPAKSGGSKLVPIIIISAVATVLLIVGVIFAIYMLEGHTEADKDEKKSKTKVSKEKDDDEETDKKKKKKQDEADDELTKEETEAAPAATEEPAAEPTPDPAAEEAKRLDEMYYAVSDVFADRTFYDGTTFGWFDPYSGSPNESFYGYGDANNCYSYSDITDFSDNTVYLSDGSSFHSLNPWTVESRYHMNGSDFRDLNFTGDIASVDRAMNAGEGPEYILPDSDWYLLDQPDTMVNITGELARYAKNEIYARHGRKFKDQELQTFFNNRSWYNGTIEPDKFKESMLSETERKNVEFLKWHEEL